MFKYFGSFFLVALAGCASVNEAPLDTNALQGIGKEVIVVKRGMPNFSAVRSLTAASIFGPLGMLATAPGQVENGNLLVKENNIADPAYEIGESLAHSMETRYGLKYHGIGKYIISDDEVSTIANAYKGTALAIDIKTTHWAFVPLSSGLGYRVVYHARMRLIDTHAPKVIAEGRCSSMPAETADVPDYDQLIANGANRIKSELKKASEHCIRELGSTYLRM